MEPLCLGEGGLTLGEPKDCHCGRYGLFGVNFEARFVIVMARFGGHCMT